MRKQRNKWLALGLLLAVCGGGCGGGQNPTAGEGGPNASGGPAAATGGGGGSSSGVYFVGFDASPPLIEALADGVLHGVVVQNPYRMGQLGVKSMIDRLEKKEVEKSISTGETLITPQNRNDPAVQELLNPPKLDHSADANASGAKAKKWRIMVIPKGTTHEFWKTIHAGAVKAAQDHGDVEIVWKGPQKEDDRTEQIALVDNAAATGVDGIVLAPLDAEALVPPVERAIAKGIPVVIIDSALKSDKPVSYVATDNYHGGQLCGQRMVELLDGKGRVILLRYSVGSASTEEREQGFLDELAKYPEITLVSSDQYGGATSDSAQKVAQNLLTRYRGQFDGVHAPNESSTSGLLRALREAGLLKVMK